MKTILLKNGHVVTPGGVERLDVLIKDGKIDRLAVDIGSGAGRVIDCAGKHILPGCIDAHVHFRTPGHEEKEDWKTGSRAAAKGGVTTVFDMPNTDPVCATVHTLNNKRKIAVRDSLVNYGFFVTVTEEHFDEFDRFGNIAGVKLYMGASTGGFFADDGLMRRVFAKRPRLIAVHAEDEALIVRNSEKFRSMHDPEIHSVIRDVEVAHRAVRRAIKLADEFDVRLHVCHLSTREELLAVRDAKRAGVRVTCEACPHHLFLTDDDYGKLGNFVKINPPLRTIEDKKALWEDGIGLGVVDIIATDHAPHTRGEKERDYWGAPSGVPGVQLMLPLLLDAHVRGRLTLERVSELTAGGPARVFGVADKGEIRKGFDADITVVDLRETFTVSDSDQESKCGWSPYTGRQLTGRPVMTLVNGVIAYSDGRFDEHVRGSEVRFQPMSLS